MRRDAESDLLFRAQEEQDPQVLEAILVALGHLGSPKPFQLFLRYATHESEDVRRAVAAFITEVAPERSDPRLVDALVGLASDTDPDVRNWATFELGSQIDASSDSVTKVLWARATDAEAEIRGEALSATNTPHFDLPNRNVSNLSNFGYVTGTVSNDSGARVLQLGAKFNF